MKEMNNKYYYDTLNLYVKKEKLDIIKSSYETFGWELVTENENDIFEDTTDLSFRRPHKINNKDDLQLLQVSMDNTLNELARIEKNKHAKSLIAGLTLGLLITALLTLGIIISLNHTYSILFCLGLALIVASLAGYYILFKFIFRLVKNENRQFKEKAESLQSNLKQICEKALNLRGE